MDTPAIRWWTPDAGFGAGVAWPADGGIVIGVRGQPAREAARLAIRAALRAALAQACQVGEDAIDLHAAEGEAPYAIVAGTRRLAAAITHDGDVSLAAFRWEGAVGLDLMQVVPVPDWEAVARDYLGPGVAAALAALPATERDAAFARAWSEHEARFKCLGWQLREWRTEDGAALQACTCLPLSAPAGYVAMLAVA